MARVIFIVRFEKVKPRKDLLLVSLVDPAVPMQLVSGIELLATDRTRVLAGKWKMQGLQMILHVMLHGEKLAADAAFKLLWEAVQDLDVIL